MKGEITRLGVAGLDDADVPGGKRCLAVAEIVVPLADEAIVKAQAANFIQP